MSNPTPDITPWVKPPDSDSLSIYLSIYLSVFQTSGIVDLKDLGCLSKIFNDTKHRQTIQIHSLMLTDKRGGGLSLGVLS